MQENRLNEAEECIKKAEKHLKTSLLGLKFKPDYDSAASEYERASVCYKNAKKLDLCIDTYLKASECYENNGNIFHSAKCKEMAALTAKDVGKMDKAKELMETAAQMYAESGSAETSAMALDKAGKFFEAVDLMKAIEIYEKALCLVQDTDKSRMAGEYLRRISMSYLKLEKYDKAAQNIEREIDLYKSVNDPNKVGKLTSGLVLVHLARGESVDANKALNNSYRVPGFIDTADAPLLKPLIDAYDYGDDEKFQSILNNAHMKSHENEYLRLTKKIKLPIIERKEQGDGQDGADEDDANGLL